jgi:hypothetical protein
MADKISWESLKADGSAILDKLKDVVREGNVRRIRVRQGERTLAEFPLTAGVVGVVFAPILAAVATIVALASDCQIDVQREETAGTAAPASGDKSSAA